MRAFSLLLCLLLGCASASKPPESGDVRPHLGARASADQRGAMARPEPVTERRLLRTASEADGEAPYVGVLDREGLVAIIDRGLGQVLARVKLRPVMKKGRFKGFRVESVTAAWHACGVRVDDVLVSLNGLPIERPEQALAAFESLRVASEVSLQVLRAGAPMALRYRIE